MLPDELIRTVDQAINRFYANDSALLESEASEWSIAHRIAVYLETGFEGWNVDCEYNRMGPNASVKQNPQGNRKRPDIVVHHRNMTEVDHNLLVIELKRANSDDDDEKLRDFTAEPAGERCFQYQYGLALSFSPTLSKRWFHKGSEITSP